VEFGGKLRCMLWFTFSTKEDILSEKITCFAKCAATIPVSLYITNGVRKKEAYKKER
jgi:hypothetical protein